MNRIYYQLLRSGQSLIELILVMGLMAVLIPVIATGFVSSRDGKVQQNQRLIASTILKETEESVRSVREKDWQSIADKVGAGLFYPVISGSTWILEPGAETLTNGFTRSITIASVNREPTPGNIVSAPAGTTDPSTLLINISINWNLPNPSNISSSFYLTRHDNLSFTQTTKADFDSGVKSNTETTIFDGGEVQLGTGGGGSDWCTPSLSLTSVNLARQGIPTAVSAVEGSIVAATGGNASGPTFSETAVSGNDPPITEYRGEYDNTKGNGVFRDNDKYAYLATDDSAEEIKILDLTQYSDPPTNTKFLKVGFFNSPNNKRGLSIFVLGDTGYMTTSSADGAEKQFYIFDLTSRLGSRNLLNADHPVTLAAQGNQIVVVNHSDGKKYAYVALNSTTIQMQVVDVTDPTNPFIVRQVQTDNNQPGIDVSINNSGTRAYLITSYAGSDKNNFFIIDTSNLNESGNLPVIGNGYNTSAVGGMNPKAIATATGNRIIIAGINGTVQYLVLSIDQENAPLKCGPGLTINGGAFDVSTVLQEDGYAYSYVVTGDTNAELKIILGGGAGQYINQGTFESSVFYKIYNENILTTAFNSFRATVAQPDQTSIKIKVAVADAIDNSCDGITFGYLGPKGDPSDPDDYYLVGTDPTLIRGLIPFTLTGSYHNPGQCFRYKVWFESLSSSATPVLYDVTVNYSP